MKVFGKKPAAILAAGSFALAMTSCQQSSTGTNSDVAKTEASMAKTWAQLIEKISKTLRGGFGGAISLGDTRNRREEDEDGGAGG
jgi:hypothetical protein